LEPITILRGLTNMVQTKEQIFDLLQQHRTQLKAFGVRRCGLFGSFLRGKQNAKSDVDLLVEFEPERKTFDNFIHLAFFLEETFGRKVELLTPESLNKYSGPIIMREVEYAAMAS
jgi:predicted nucleotidyltransferase